MIGLHRPPLGIAQGHGLDPLIGGKGQRQREAHGHMQRHHLLGVIGHRLNMRIAIARSRRHLGPDRRGQQGKQSQPPPHGASLTGGAS
jgi:hypothetical protein